jgi:hypothetical protein
MLMGGFEPISVSAGLGDALLIFMVTACSVALVPFLVLGIVVRRRSPDFTPWLVYAPIVFLGAALLYPAHIRGGAFFHSAIGLFPHAAILTLEGAAFLGRGLVVARPAGGSSWALAGVGGAEREGLPVRLLVGLVVVFALATAVIFGRPVVEAWSDVRAPRIALAAELDRRAVPRTDRLMSLDAAGTKYWTGHPGVVTPNDPIETIEAVARAYDIRWLVLEAGSDGEDGPVPALAPILTGGPRPAWVGPQAFTVTATNGAPRLALYPVCTTAADARCSA